MRSRAVRLSCVATAWIALSAAAFFLVQSEQQLAAARAAERVFDQRAHEVTAALSDLRAAQQAYVAAGQGATFWMPKVAQTADDIRTSIASLRATATSADAQAGIDEGSAALARLDEVDGRARDYLELDQTLMAGDVIFSEGDQAAVAAARQIEGARLAERGALETADRDIRRQQALALTGAGGVSALVVLLLGVAGGTREVEDSPLSIAPSVADGERARPAPEAGPPASRPVSPVLKAAAQLCTDFGCVRDERDLRLLLARAGDVMDAAGLVVWLGNAQGADLRPILTYGYSDEARARLPNVPRTAGNAAAAAYRSGEVQIVAARPGGAKGAIVAPILGTEGCVGALSAEIDGGGEASESVQALASIVAAQLAGVLATSPAERPEARAAASS